MKERKKIIKELKEKEKFVAENYDKDLSFLKRKLGKNFHIFITDQNYTIKKTTFKYDENFSLAFAKDLLSKHKNKIGLSLPICEPATAEFFIYADTLKDNRVIQTGYIINSKKIQKLKNELRKTIKENSFIKDISLFFIHPTSQYAQECKILTPIGRKYTLEEMMKTRKYGIKLYEKLRESNPLITENEMYILGQSPFNQLNYVIFKLSIDNNILTAKIKKTIFISFVTLIILTAAAFIMYLEIKKTLSYLEEFSFHIQKEKTFEKKIDNEIYDTVKAYNNTLGKIQNLLKSKDEFIHFAMHELATPINIISLYSDVYTELKPAVKKLLNSYKNLSFIINPAKKQNIELIDLNETLKNRIEYFKEIAQIENKNIIFKSNGTLNIKAVKEDIEILIDNNIKNAINYSKSDNIFISLDKNVLIFENEGTIKAPDKIFEKFYREDKIKGGFGLGLSIIKKIADKYNIEVYILQNKNNVIFKYIFKENDENSGN